MIFVSYVIPSQLLIIPPPELFQMKTPADLSKCIVRSVEHCTITTCRIQQKLLQLHAGCINLNILVNVLDLERYNVGNYSSTHSTYKLEELSQ